jgi:hypothetical protein
MGANGRDSLLFRGACQLGSYASSGPAGSLDRQAETTQLKALSQGLRLPQRRTHAQQVCEGRGERRSAVKGRCGQGSTCSFAWMRRVVRHTPHSTIGINTPAATSALMGTPAALTALTTYSSRLTT